MTKAWWTEPVTGDAVPCPPAPLNSRGPALCVLASGSRGNCALLLGPAEAGGERPAVLIDAGLSPKATFAALEQAGVAPERLRAVLFTHLDHDHCHPGWSAPSPAMARLPRHTRVLVHRRHMGRAQRMMLNGSRAEPFTESVVVDDWLTAEVTLAGHDSLGVAVFAMRVGGALLGWATDLGRPTSEVLEHLACLRDCGTLAIESNYCPERQMASARPEFLKQRIMGGAGHLSNQQTLAAVRQVRPVHAVLLHLSQQCNCPEAVRSLHEGSGVPITVASQDAPTPWLALAPAPAGVARVPRRVSATRAGGCGGQLALFEPPPG